MKYLFAVRDVVAGAFGSLHAEKHEAVAIRNFVTACVQPDSMFAKFPKDYELVCLGEFREDAGEYSLDDGHLPIFGGVPRVVITAQAAIASSNPDGQLSLIKEA